MLGMDTRKEECALQTFSFQSRCRWSLQECDRRGGGELSTVRAEQVLTSVVGSQLPFEKQRERQMGSVNDSKLFRVSFLPLPFSSAGQMDFYSSRSFLSLLTLFPVSLSLPSLTPLVTLFWFLPLQCGG